ncbi:MAG TPA: hypothetical protein VGD67_14040, partial [Pseudonocardiaceae bacterium]
REHAEPPARGPAALLARAVREGRGSLIAATAALTVIVSVGATLIALGSKGEPADVAFPVPTSTADGTGDGGSSSDGPGSTAAPSTTTSTTTTTSATTSTTPPAALDVLTGSIDFGAGATDALLRFRNTGGRPLTWSVSSSDRAVTMEPFNGTVPAGQSAAISVRLNRAGLAEGDFAASLKLVAAGTTTVPVTAVENRPPVIGDLGSAPAWVVYGNATCETARVQASVTDDTPVAVTVSWQSGGGPVNEAATSAGGGRYAATIGPASAAGGTLRWWVTATDSRGNTVRGPDQTVEVRADPEPCPTT